MRPKKEDQRFEFETLRIESDRSEHQYQQLENQLRDAIASGKIAGGSRVPSSRALAKQLGISRNTVLSAYQQLISEGYLQSQHGSGTRVSELPPETFVSVSNATGRPKTRDLQKTKTKRSPLVADFSRRLSANGKRYAEYAKWVTSTAGKPVPFRPHIPSLDQFPLATWNRLQNDLARWSTTTFENADPQGYLPLRQSIAEYMAVSRGVQCTEQQVVITAGAQQGIQLLSQTLLEPGDTVWVEQPGNAPANQILSLMGQRVEGVRVDSQGIEIADAIERQLKTPKLIYVTPSCQWPLSVTMSLSRRLELIQQAQTSGSWIVEDDYNGEYRFSGRPQPALCSLDQSGQTIYMGTFSKMLFPAIRLGFLVVPEQIAGPLSAARWLMDRFSPPLQQMTLHRFIESGHFLKHVRQMRSLYRDRQGFLADLLEKRFGDAINVVRPDSGMHLVVYGRNKSTEKRLCSAAIAAGVHHHTVQMYASGDADFRGIILGFAPFDASTTRRAVNAWARRFS